MLTFSRYPDIQFDIDADFECPKCRGSCNCTACTPGGAYISGQITARTDNDVESMVPGPSGPAAGVWSTLYHCGTGEEIGTAYAAADFENSDPVSFNWAT